MTGRLEYYTVEKLQEAILRAYAIQEYSSILGGDSEGYINLNETFRFLKAGSWQRGSDPLLTFNNISVFHEASYGGEGEGNAFWVVIRLTDGNTTRYLRADGWYASYYGGEFDSDLYEVNPQERKVVVYE